MLFREATVGSCVLSHQPYQLKEARPRRTCFREEEGRTPWLLRHLEVVLGAQKGRFRNNVFQYPYMQEVPSSGGSQPASVLPTEPVQGPGEAE